MSRGTGWIVDGGPWRWVDRGLWIMALGGSWIVARGGSEIVDLGAGWIVDRGSWRWVDRAPIYIINYMIRAPTNGSRRFFLCLFYCCFCCCHVRDVSGGDVITVLACFVAVAVGTHVSLVVMSRANAGSWASDSASLKSLRAWAGSVYVYSLGLCLSVIVRNM